MFWGQGEMTQRVRSLATKLIYKKIKIKNILVDSKGPSQKDSFVHGILGLR